MFRAWPLSELHSKSSQTCKSAAAAASTFQWTLIEPTSTYKAGHDPKELIQPEFAMLREVWTLAEEAGSHMNRDSGHRAQGLSGGLGFRV